MTDTIVLLHGGATRSSSWNPVARALVSCGASVFAPEMLGSGASPPQEVAHLTRLLGLQPYSCNRTIYAVGFGGTFHLVTHSLGSLIGLHLRRALGARVTGMTLVDPAFVDHMATLAWLVESPPPTAIVVGERTLLAQRAAAHLLGAALRATTVVVPGAAHMIPVTHPEAVVDAVRRAMVA